MSHNRKVRIALLDMNNGEPNHGMGNIIDLAENFKKSSPTPIEINIYDVRAKNEIPQIEDFDICISSGGPGTPLPEGKEWEKNYASFLTSVWTYNLQYDQKKYLFLICHSFQLAVNHWNLAFVTKRKSYSFGILPIHKTKEGQKEVLFSGLDNPFYAVDSRAYQCIKPKKERFKQMGAKIVAIEKIRPHIHLERAVMAIRFSAEIFGTQFHPEAEPVSFNKNLEDEKNRKSMIQKYGQEKYLQTLDRVNDEDKIIKTYAEILPQFLATSTESVLQNESTKFEANHLT